MAIGAIEARFYGELIEGLGLDPASLPPQNDYEHWPEMTNRFSQVFRTKTRDEWCAIFEGKDACVAPVLDLDEVGSHPHNQERALFVNIDGVSQPAPAPRLSRTPGEALKPGGPRGSNTREILKEQGYSDEELHSLISAGVVE